MPRPFPRRMLLVVAPPSLKGDRAESRRGCSSVLCASITHAAGSSALPQAPAHSAIVSYRCYSSTLSQPQRVVTAILDSMVLRSCVLSTAVTAARMAAAARPAAACPPPDPLHSGPARSGGQHKAARSTPIALSGGSTPLVVVQIRAGPASTLRAPRPPVMAARQIRLQLRHDPDRGRPASLQRRAQVAPSHPQASPYARIPRSADTRPGTCARSSPPSWPV